MASEIREPGMFAKRAGYFALSLVRNHPQTPLHQIVSHRLVKIPDRISDWSQFGGQQW